MRNPDWTVVTLNEAEQRLAEYVARARYHNNRKNGVVDRKMGGQSNELTDLDGIAGEIAFCKLFNVFPDLQTERPGGRCDAWTRTLGAVDVKATWRPRGRLLVTMKKKDKPPDTFALMIGDYPTYRFVGWARAEDVIVPGTLRDLGRGVSHVVDQDRLERPDPGLLEGEKEWHGSRP